MWQFGVLPGNSMALAVLHFMTSRLHRGTNAVVMSHTAIAALMAISDRTVRTATQNLAKANFIQILKSGSSNVYVINHRVAWQGKRGARFAAFGADLLVYEAEQEVPVDQLIHESESLNTVPSMFSAEDSPFDDEEIESNLPNPDQHEIDHP